MEYDAKPHRLRVLGCVGFLGLLGFSYFLTHRPMSLAYFGFFGYFAYFILAKAAAGMPDERYRENQQRARSTLFPFALCGFFVLAFAGAALPFPAVTVLLCALLFAAFNIGFAAIFVHYENQ